MLQLKFIKETNTRVPKEEEHVYYKTFSPVLLLDKGKKELCVISIVVTRESMKVHAYR